MAIQKNPGLLRVQYFKSVDGVAVMSVSWIAALSLAMTDGVGVTSTSIVVGEAGVGRGLVEEVPVQYRAIASQMMRVRIIISQARLRIIINHPCEFYKHDCETYYQLADT